MNPMPLTSLLALAADASATPAAAAGAASAGGWILPLLIVVPVVFAVLIGSLREASAAKLGLAGSLVFFALTLVAMFAYDWSDAAAYGLTARVDWIREFGLSFSLGADGVSMVLIALTGLLAPVCVLVSLTAIDRRRKLFYAWLMALQAAMIGVFAARDLLVFYISFEFTLLPMYILISVFGSTNRKKAATKFFLYTFTGSLITLAGLFYVVYSFYEQHQEWTLDIAALGGHCRTLPLETQALVLAAMLAGFAVKVPLFPVHTWLPLAHTEAPTAGSVVLAGVLLKLGTYGFYRFVLPFVPAAAYEYAPAIAVLSIVGILYAGLICWVQRDIKKLVAYSSVSHLGFCVLGLFTLNTTGLTGSVLYMINHGLSTGALFCLIGFMYERYHTRDMDAFGGLAARMPVWATFMVFFSMASVGLPGLNGFVSEFLCLIGTFQSSTDLATPANPGATFGPLGPWFAAVAGVGMIIGAIYLLYMVGRSCFGPLREPDDGAGHHAHPVLPADLNAREILTLAPLAVLCVVLGLFPKPLIDAVEPSVVATVDAVRRHAIAPADGAHGSTLPVPVDAARSRAPAAPGPVHP